MIYIHVPFCRSFCTYCDFYSEIACKGREMNDFEAYASGIISEISERGAEIAASAGTNTLYIGGGTPSVLPLSVLGRLLEALGGGAYDEFTLEVNPEDILEKGPSYLAGLRRLGVNRISMGVQSLDDCMLRWMNRRHDADGAGKAFRALRDAGFDNISVDVIFGLSHLTEAVLEKTLDEVLAWKPEHISAYQLSIEDGSALARMVEDGRYEEAEDDLCLAQYGHICRRLREAGYEHYEISNWSLPGYEAKHNSAYWTREAYVGLGPGAHSFDGKRRSWNSQALCSWTSESEILSEDEAREEQIMLGLRTAKGIPESICDRAAVETLVAEGALISIGDAQIRIPESSFFVSDSIIAKLI